MKYLEAAILGLVQGLTEFLPVSSSGHLMLLERYGIGEESLAFNLLLHLATLFAVCIVYRKKIFALMSRPLRKELLMLLAASVPTVLIVLFVRLFLMDAGIVILPFGFIVTSVFLFLGQMSKKNALETEIKLLPALITGTAQGIAALAGISRSGSTVSTQLMLGINPEKAGDFSFLLSIPVIAGSAIVELIGFHGLGRLDFGTAAVGMTVAFLSGLIAIKFFLKILKKGSLLPFSIYTFFLGIFSFIFIF